jgi:hypothetical protein
MEFLKEYSHDIMCWSISIGICGLLFLVMILIDMAWNSAFKVGYDKGYDKGYSDGSNASEVV